MNTPRPPSPDAMLTPEERALAERIARTAPAREPSPALDARILAAARAAATPGRTSAPPQRPGRRRWPAVTAAAATLVLAVGIAWQLRPVDDTRVQYSEAPRAAARIATPAGGPQASDDARQAETGETVVADDVAAARTAPSTAPEAEAPAAAQHKPLPAPAPLPPEGGLHRKTAAEPAPAEARVGTPAVSDQPSPAATDAPEPRPIAFPAPQPAPAPAAPARTQSTPAADVAATGAQDRDQPARREAQQAFAPPAGASAATAIGTTASERGKTVVAPAPAPAADANTDAAAPNRIEVTGTREEDAADQPLADLPPASVDSPQVREAWLQRVRELVADGDLEAARKSLGEYRRRYPQATLPDDLRALLDE